MQRGLTQTDRRGQKGSGEGARTRRRRGRRRPRRRASCRCDPSRPCAPPAHLCFPKTRLFLAPSRPFNGSGVGARGRCKVGGDGSWARSYRLGLPTAGAADLRWSLCSFHSAPNPGRSRNGVPSRMYCRVHSFASLISAHGKLKTCTPLFHLWKGDGLSSARQ